MMSSTLVAGPEVEPVVSTRTRSVRTRHVAPAVGVLGLLLVVAAYVVSKNYEVVAEGNLLPYPAQVAKIRFFDQFTLVVAQERTRPLDVLDAALLSMIAGTAFFVLALLRRASAGTPRIRAFFALCLLGSMFLAVDESLALHESLGDNMQFLTSLPGVHRPDDLIFASYLVPAAAFVVLFRDVILSSRTARKLFAAGVALFFAAAFFDVAGIGLDEMLEPLSSGCLLAGFTVLALDALRNVGFAAVPRMGSNGANGHRA
jgi:hypothetical protein